ncbi:MAG: triacylglycerol lipase, partial [Streptococcaceae bacterium]|nr:triacylglycerol lipase [Streptococcaceae bacterium]
MSTNENYNALANQVYNVDLKSKGDVHWKEGNVILPKYGGGQSYRVLYSSDNPDGNGFQGMAVAPIVNGVVDTSQVTIAYAGTNQSDPKDLLTDTESVVANSGGFAGGSGVSESQ